VLAPPGSTERPVLLVEKRDVEQILEWPGTVRSRTEARPAPKILSRVRELRVEVGSVVKAGDRIAVLDDREWVARVGQASMQLGAAVTEAMEADAEYLRLEGLWAIGRAAKRDLDEAKERSSAASARVDHADLALVEAEVLLREAVIRAPVDGVVAELFARPGDTAVPGKPLLSIQDPLHLRLEAPVTERCARGATVGQIIHVKIDFLGRDMTAAIEEIVPVANPESPTFLIRAALQPDEDIRTGMFGRMLVPCGRRTALLIPESAVTRSGQLETVEVVESGETGTRQIRTGRRYGEKLEVLSGLLEGEKILPQGK
jgi:RND family efflux transporter MFP subunit